MSSPNQLIFLVTGSSSGLGLSLCHAILSAGHKVIATMRNPSASPSTLSNHPDARILQLDVTAPDLEARIEQARLLFGHIDVLINNAGYGYGGPIETSTLSRARHQMETLFWGPVRAARAVIPHMRGRGRGVIVNVSSTEGVCGTPGIGFYGAGKHALEGVSEALAGELAGFGVRVVLVQPGTMRTAFFDPDRTVVDPVGEAYLDGPVGMLLRALATGREGPMLDPERCARRIVEAVVGGDEGESWPKGRESFLRLPLGAEMLARGRGQAEKLQENWAAMEKVALSCDFPEEA